MENTKMTKAMKFNRLAEIVSSATIAEEEKTMFAEFFAHELELIKKKSASKTPTAQQKQNEEAKTTILEILSAHNGMTITELTKTPPLCLNESMSHHRVSALVTILKNEGKVKREEVKGVAFFFATEKSEE